MAEFPKWLHKGWKAAEHHAVGYHVPAESKLVETAAEAKELLAKGWTEEAPKPPAKKDAEKDAK